MHIHTKDKTTRVVWYLMCIVPQDAANFGRPVTVHNKKGNLKISNVREIIQSDGSYTILDIAKLLAYRYHRCVLFWSVFCKRFLQYGYRMHWQMTKRVRAQLLKMFPKFIQTNCKLDETWVHYLKPLRKSGNKIW